MRFFFSSIFHYHIGVRVEYCIQIEIRYILHSYTFELSIVRHVLYACIIYTAALQPCPQLVFC